MTNLIKKRILIIGTDGVPARYGGFETLVSQLAQVKEFSEFLQVDVQTSSHKREHFPNRFGEFNIHYNQIKPNGAWSVIYDALGLWIGYRKKYDFIICLGVSVGLALSLCRLFKFRGRIIVNVDGVEWRREKWNFFARSILKFAEKVCVANADTIIADNQGIVDYLIDQYPKLDESKVMMIPYGGDQFRAKNAPIDNSRKIFCLSRIEPENNVDMILSAVNDSGAQCIYFGNWEISSYSRRLYSDFGPKMDLRLPEYNIEKLSKEREQCHYYVHGHSAGGTNPSLVEAMHSGHSVIAFDCVYNRYTTNNEAYYFKSKEELFLLLQQIEQDTLEPNADKMLEIAQDFYTWKSVARDYLKCIGV